MEDINITPNKSSENSEITKEEVVNTQADEKSFKRVWIILGILVIILIGLIAVFIGQTQSEVVDNSCKTCETCGNCYYSEKCEECNPPEICSDKSCGKCSECLKADNTNDVSKPIVENNDIKEPEEDVVIEYVGSEQTTVNIPEGAIIAYNSKGIYETKIDDEVAHPSKDGVIHTGSLNWFQKDCEKFSVYSKKITNTGDSVIITLTIKSAHTEPIRLHAPVSISINGYSIPISGLDISGVNDGVLTIGKQATMSIELYIDDLINSGIDKVRTIDINGLSVSDAASGAVFFIDDFTLKTSYSGSSQSAVETYGNLIAVGAEGKVQAIQSNINKNTDGSYTIPVTILNDSDEDLFVGTANFKLNGTEQSSVYSTTSTVSSNGTAKCGIVMPLNMLGIAEKDLEEIKFTLFLRSSDGGINIIEDITLKILHETVEDSENTSETN